MYSGPIDCVRKTLRTEGFPSLYTGHFATMLREIPGTSSLPSPLSVIASALSFASDVMGMHQKVVWRILEPMNVFANSSHPQAKRRCVVYGL
jgi:hypothetical protein